MVLRILNVYKVKLLVYIKNMHYTKTLNTKSYESNRVLSIKPVSTSKFAPMTRTTVASRGGFGGSRTVTVGG